MFDFKDEKNTHMPFVAIGENFFPQQFCCIRIGELWKVHYCTADGNWKRYNTGLPEDFTECGPCAEYDNKTWKVSFIAGGGESDRRFFLYQQIGDIGGDGKSEKVIEANVGYVWKSQSVYAGRRGAIWQIESGMNTKITLRGIEYLYRLSYNPQRPRQMLISGQTTNDELVSIAYVPGMSTIQVLKDNEKSCYKAALWGTDCFYAKRGNDGFEDRHIVKAQNFSAFERAADEYIEKCEFINNFYGEFE